MNKSIITVIILIILIGGIYSIVKNSKQIEMPVTSTSGNLNSNSNNGNSPQPSQPTGNNNNTEPAALAARKDLSAKLGVSEQNIQIKNVSQMTWNDGCLGLGKMNEVCLQALVSGYRVEMVANGKTYFYRTDQTGGTVRVETQ